MNSRAKAPIILANPHARWFEGSSLASRRSRSRRIATAADATGFIGRCLSYDNSAALRSDLGDLLKLGEIDWLLVVSLSNQSHLTPALEMGLQRKALSCLLPSDLRAYLEMISDLNRERNRLIARQAGEFFAALNGQGVRPVLMKGGLCLFEADLDMGLPMMADVDVLLPEEQFPLACSILRALGYVSFGEPAPYAHAVTFHRAGELATIDLHRRVGPQIDLLTSADACRSAIALPSRDLDLAGLSPTHRVLLQLMNFCVFEPQYCNRELPLRGLHDLAVICRRYHPHIEWAAIAEAVVRYSLDAPARAWFNMAQALLGVPIPESLREGRAPRRHLSLCLLQLRFPWLARPFRYAARLTWIFSAWRMDYRYGCGLRGWPLAATRLRHAFAVLLRRCGAAVAPPNRGLTSR